MPDTAKIQPALTAEEWREVARLHARGYFQATADLPPRLREMALEFDQHRAMAVSNFALPDDDPRRITAKDVVRLNEAAGGLEDVGAPHLGAAIAAIAAKLAALLPPEPDSSLEQLIRDEFRAKHQ